MSSLVEELQRDALDGNVNVSDLLRKAYVVAVKLKLDKFKAWCEFELNGYKSDLPDYRVIRGILRAWNPYNGWIPVMLQGDGDSLTLHQEGGPIGPLQDLIGQGDESNNLIVYFSPRQQEYVQRRISVPLEVTLHIGRSSVVGILDAVRNLILDWSLKLEGDGILGDGMSFSPEERKRASVKSDELQAPVNFISIGTMVNSTIQQANPTTR